MKRFMCFGLIFVLLLSAAVVGADKEKDCSDMVSSAAAAFKDKGKDYALKLLNTSTGPFRKAELYVFAISSVELSRRILQIAVLSAKANWV